MRSILSSDSKSGVYIHRGLNPLTHYACTSGMTTVLNRPRASEKKHSVIGKMAQRHTETFYFFSVTLVWSQCLKVFTNFLLSPEMLFLNENLKYRIDFQLFI